ncbi:MAG: tRNA (adenosine(37)-N6)-dimethylallyltransferase MiaA [Candidatus Doudnabacteria bacterium RIFCSPHIGHO2_02_FULL_48_21]|uniref:tRNA dimethylallyltransferase n=1 Tax=Candidatus Doudnabacteria bacterium RIFCSPLOWO2_02_FULL_48_13 TaxID=1817845 RepID=A0A1F5QA61_9BACT|nr:MAG: tRNA (adenosine(37)-N6)-dimethylallyltransferase MiaA [Candidatus Doudnabacteria bacterium RIFCSPHIGHO2_01_48_18]OGE78439.1 MAG: tRNA (adenosine(37)-N6)-dimethylallyltransferase MiaA [Candidatus Doudnabacteria bacterium RIFCSPHIGHO2_01_FULL_48_180]OGE91693.1 MAG: tRNA (adenosine(37)-N6)-dimethylallyltransferase MiaA [Candidatus Doudnabacteria bacterium RIFCSPHIGHO2_12_FULL_47_25]OGE93430.1 MAG: tRNA (adenosine(37)-N6)-dimethylallyltransferase MiaA [Candidatus Doudnabacteria bacterium RIF
MTLPKLVIITGPTAAGKTALSLKLAKKFTGEIISADSRQIYTQMDIGTAKATKKELKNVPHHLIDVRTPDKDYTLAQFKRDAIKTIKQIQKRGRVPFLVGGTALYINALVSNLEIPEVKPNKKLRKKLEKLSLNELYKKLVSLDPEAAYIIDPKNPRRIIRALEITASGKLYSQTRKKGPQLFDMLVLGINAPGAKLKRNIERRVDIQIKNGLVKEVKNLIKRYGKKPQAFDAIGYREVIAYLEKKITFKEAIAQIKKNTWYFAKRQNTWFRKLPINWINNQGQAEKMLAKFIRQ